MTKKASDNTPSWANRPTSSLPAWGLRGLPYVLFGKRFLPPILNFLVTNRCTLRCRHCFNWQISADTNETGDDLVDTPLGRLAPAVGPELTLEEIEQVAMNLGPLVFLILAGGEPFLRQDLSEIAAAFYRHNGVRNLVILTDGQLTASILSATERILRACPDLFLTVGVSLDGLEEVHDRIRGRPGAFARAVTTSRELTQRKAGCARLGLQTCSVFMAENQEAFGPLLDFIRDELRPDKVAVNLIRQQPRDSSLIEVSLDRYEAITRRIREETFRGRFKNKYASDTTGFITLVDLHMHELIARTRRTGKPQLTCQAGRISAVLQADGTLGPCEIRRPWGNLRETDWKTEPLWFSSAAEQCRRQIRSGCCCTHEIDCFLPSIPFSPACYPSLLRIAWQWKQAAGWKKVN